MVLCEWIYVLSFLCWGMLLDSAETFVDAWDGGCYEMTWAVSLKADERERKTIGLIPGKSKKKEEMLPTRVKSPRG